MAAMPFLYNGILLKSVLSTQVQPSVYFKIGKSAQLLCLFSYPLFQIIIIFYWKWPSFVFDQFFDESNIVSQIVLCYSQFVFVL